ncbi:MAG: methionyl-tRNA formyltransferase [Dissulfurispiraceae bacterium]
MAFIFFGTPQFAIPSLDALINNSEDVACVITQPDKAGGRRHLISSPPIKDFALSRGLQIMQPENVTEDAFCEALSRCGPEFIVVVAYGKLLPEKILRIPRSGCINVHASLLPKYRGAAPVQWALLNGETKTGVTTMLMDKGLDTGDILLRAPLDINEDDDGKTLGVRLAALGAETLIQTLQGIRKGTITPTPQTGEIVYAPPLRKKDGKIDWDRSAIELFNFVKGMFPWPAAYCYLYKDRIKMIKVRPIAGHGVPGRIEKASGGSLIVGTGNGLLSVEQLQPEGKKPMSAEAFIAGRKLEEGHEKFS